MAIRVISREELIKKDSEGSIVGYNHLHINEGLTVVMGVGAWAFDYKTTDSPTAFETINGFLPQLSVFEPKTILNGTDVNAKVSHYFYFFPGNYEKIGHFREEAKPICEIENSFITEPNAFSNNASVLYERVSEDKRYLSFDNRVIVMNGDNANLEEMIDIAISHRLGVRHFNFTKISGFYKSEGFQYEFSPNKKQIKDFVELAARKIREK